jgi:hypothetical protein
MDRHEQTAPYAAVKKMEEDDVVEVKEKRKKSMIRSRRVAIRAQKLETTFTSRLLQFM